MTDDPTRIAAEILRLTAARGPNSSICPSEVARALTGDSLTDNWRPLLGPVRREAARLAERGDIDILRKGRAIAPTELRGVIRLRARAAGPP